MFEIKKEELVPGSEQKEMLLRDYEESHVHLEKMNKEVCTCSFPIFLIFRNTALHLTWGQEFYSISLNQIVCIEKPLLQKYFSSAPHVKMTSLLEGNGDFFFFLTLNSGNIIIIGSFYYAYLLNLIITLIKMALKLTPNNCHCI